MYFVSGHLLFNFCFILLNWVSKSSFLSPAKSPDPFAEQKIQPLPFLKLGHENPRFRRTLKTRHPKLLVKS